MMKYEVAYYEAQKILLTNNCVSEELQKSLDLSGILNHQMPARKPKKSILSSNGSTN